MLWQYEEPQQRCSYCVMDTTVPGIVFDANGECNFCQQAKLRIDHEWHRDDSTALPQLIAKIKQQRSGQYDCLIGVSGGVDSSFVAYLCKQYDLNPLAVHLDNGWNSELAVANIHTILNKLNIDLITHVIDWQEFRDVQRSVIFSSIRNWEIPTDNAIQALMMKVARQHGIRYVISGGNIATEVILPTSWHERALDLRLLNAVHKKFGTLSRKTMPTIGLLRYAYYVFVSRLRVINLLNYCAYDKAAAMLTLANELGWRPYGAKHFESIFTRFFQAYVLPVKYNIDKRKAHFSSLIVTGQMLRDEAIAQLTQNPYPDQAQFLSDKAFFLKKLGFTEQAFAEIMQAPIKTARDYPSNQAIFDGLPKLLGIAKQLTQKV